MKPTPILTLSLLCIGAFALFAYAPTQTPQTAAIATLPPFTFKQSTLQVTEGQSARITVVAPSNLTKTTRVTYTVTPQGGATVNKDYRLPSTRTLTFYKGGLKEKTITIPTISDALSESNESFTVRLTGVSGASVQVGIVERGGGVASTTTSTSTSTTSSTVPGRTPWYTCKSPQEMAIINGFPLALQNNTVLGPSTFGVTPPDAPIVGQKNDRMEVVGYSFPGYRSSAQVRIPVRSGEYQSVRLTVPLDAKAGDTIQWNPILTPNDSSRYWFSLSECQGDFRGDVLQKRFYVTENTDPATTASREIECFTTGQAGAGSFRMRIYNTYPTKYTDLPDAMNCPVVPGRTYYLNITAGPIIVSANGFDPSTGIITQNDPSGLEVSSQETMQRFDAHPDNIRRGYGSVVQRSGITPFMVSKREILALINVYPGAGFGGPGSSGSGWFDDVRTCMIRTNVPGCNPGREEYSSQCIGNCLDAYPKRTLPGRD